MSSKPILLIGGIDPSGHAGLLRDLATANAAGFECSCVVTALTAQSAKKYSGTYPVPIDIIEAQLKSVGPLHQFGAIKTGMLVNRRTVQLLTRVFKKEKKLPPLVVDPVIWSTTGGKLLTKKGHEALAKKLLPLATLWTPNVDEAEYFSGMTIKNKGDVEKAAANLWAQLAAPLLIKGGHLKGDAHDYFFDEKKGEWLKYPRLPLKNPRGMGCRLATLIACQLADGKTLGIAIHDARLELENNLKKEINAVVTPRTTRPKILKSLQSEKTEAPPSLDRILA